MLKFFSRFCAFLKSVFLSRLLETKGKDPQRVFLGFFLVFTLATALSCAVEVIFVVMLDMSSIRNLVSTPTRFIVLAGIFIAVHVAMLLLFFWSLLAGLTVSIRRIRDTGFPLRKTAAFFLALFGFSLFLLLLGAMQTILLASFPVAAFATGPVVLRCGYGVLALALTLWLILLLLPTDSFASLKESF